MRGNNQKYVISRSSATRFDLVPAMQIKMNIHHHYVYKGQAYVSLVSTCLRSIFRISFISIRLYDFIDAIIVKALLLPVLVCMNVVAKRPCLLQHIKVTQQSLSNMHLL